MDALLNILAPVVERIKDESNGAPADVVAAALVRSCSCKAVAHMSLGAPAAASKVLGYSDSKCSTEAANCPMWPILNEASAAFGISDSTPASTEDDNESQRGDQNSDSDSEDSNGGTNAVFINGASGTLRVSSSIHHLYFRRCRKDDSSHPYHGMSYVVWMRRVRVEVPKKNSTLDCNRNDPGDEEPIDEDGDEEPIDEEPDGESIEDCCDSNSAKKAARKPGRRPNDRHQPIDEEPEGESIEDCCDTNSAKKAARKPGRKPNDRHQFVGFPKTEKQQVCAILSYVQIYVPVFSSSSPSRFSTFRSCASVFALHPPFTPVRSVLGDT